MRNSLKSVGTCLLVASAAFSLSTAKAESWGPWSDSNQYGSGAGSGRGDLVGDGTGVGEAGFDMKLKGRGNTRSDFRGHAAIGWRGDAYGYDNPPYWGGGPYGQMPMPPWGAHPGPAFPQQHHPQPQGYSQPPALAPANR